MWRITEHLHDTSSDNYRLNFGPDYGVDYARFSDPPNPIRDFQLWEKIKHSLAENNEEAASKIELIVRNGFVIIKGDDLDRSTREEMARLVSLCPGVVEVINQIKIH